MEQTAIYDCVTAPRGGKEEHEYQYAKRFNPYVYSTSRNAALIHKVLRVQIRWWDFDYRCMRRRQSPVLIAETACGCLRRISGTKARTCIVPRPDAVLCAACQGKGRNFPRGRTPEIPLALAKVRLGCVESPL